MEKTQKLPRLKPKEKVFAKKYVANDENGIQTVQEVYGIEDPNYAAVKAHRLIMKDNVSQAIAIEKETLKSALEKQGITPERIAIKIDELLDATDKDGVSDYTAIDKGLKHATNIYGVEDEPTKKPTGNTYNFIFSEEVQKDVKELEARIKARLIQGNNVQEN